MTRSSVPGGNLPKPAGRCDTIVAHQVLEVVDLTWNAQDYLKFEDERTRPARDLLARVPLQSAERVIDLGCGPGNSTELLIERFGLGAVSGLDNDDDMLAKARSRLPFTSFLKADLSTWRPEVPADLLYSNAVFQWVPHHLDVLVALMETLAPGGVLAVQMPDNLAEPSHRAMDETAADGPWASGFAEGWAKRAPLAGPATYINRLQPISANVEVWHTVYYHPMRDAQAIADWVESTGLRPYLAAVKAEHRDAFRKAYLARIDAAYPPMADGRRLLAFPRFFLIAKKK